MASVTEVAGGQRDTNPQEEVPKGKRVTDQYTGVRQKSERHEENPNKPLFFPREQKVCVCVCAFVCSATSAQQASLWDCKTIENNRDEDVSFHHTNVPDVALLTNKQTNGLR